MKIESGETKHCAQAVLQLAHKCVARDLGKPQPEKNI